MKKKIKSCRGVSIAEMLVAVVLLSLLTAGGVTVTAAVMSNYIRMKEAANADILASTVIEALSNEIRLGQDINLPEVDPSTATSKRLTLTSAYFGEGAELKLNDGRLVAREDGESELKQVLSDNAYSGLHLEDLTFKKEEGSGATTGRTVYKISFTVCNGSNSELWKNSASAAPMLEPPV